MFCCLRWKNGSLLGLYVAAVRQMSKTCVNRQHAGVDEQVLTDTCRTETSGRSSRELYCIQHNLQLRPYHMHKHDKLCRQQHNTKREQPPAGQQVLLCIKAPHAAQVALMQCQYHTELGCNPLRTVHSGYLAPMQGLYDQSYSRAFVGSATTTGLTGPVSIGKQRHLTAVKHTASK